jgi:hypothetical protein
MHWIFKLMLLASLAVSSSLYGANALQASFTSSSTQTAPRADATSNLVDWWQVRNGPGVFISCFGLNTGSAQFIQLFDSKSGPTLAITGWDSTKDTFTATNHQLGIGTRLQLTNSLAGTPAGIYYVGGTNNAAGVTVRDPDSFALYDTLAHAQAAGATGRQDLGGVSGTGTMYFLPLHVFRAGATDNFSCIIPVTGFGYNRGLVVAISTTSGTWTAGAKEATYLVTTQ